MIILYRITTSNNETQGRTKMSKRYIAKQLPNNEWIVVERTGVKPDYADIDTGLWRGSMHTASTLASQMTKDAANIERSVNKN